MGGRMDADLDVDVALTARQKSALLWGAVGLLVFLVLHQGYLLVGGNFLGVGPVALVAALVFAAATIGSYYTEGHLQGFQDPVEEEPDTGEWVWAGDEESDDEGADDDAPAGESPDGSE